MPFMQIGFHPYECHLYIVLHNSQMIENLITKTQSINLNILIEEECAIFLFGLSLNDLTAEFP